MDKLSRFWVGLEDFYDTEIEGATYILADMIKDDARGTDGPDTDNDADYEDDSEDGEADEARHEYNIRFSQSIPEIYMGHAEKMKEHEYNVRTEAMDVIRVDDRSVETVEDRGKDGSLRLDFDLMLAEDAGRVEYRGAMGQQSPDAMAPEHESVTYKAGMLNIEYESPELINGQATYQRIVFEVDGEGETVYEMTMRKFMEAGIEASSEYDQEFDSMIFTSLNKRSEGDSGNFNEFYLNGEIGDNAVDKKLLQAGDIVEWRYAEETDGSCGGVPDFKKIKNMLQQYNGTDMEGMYGGPQEMSMISPILQRDVNRPYAMAA